MDQSIKEYRSNLIKLNEAAIALIDKLAVEENISCDEINKLIQEFNKYANIPSNVTMKSCKHCGKPFIAATRRIVYCDRVDESGMRCSAAGYQEKFRERMKDDEALQIYHRAYKTHHARMKRGNISKEHFQAWRDEALLNLEKVRKGMLDIITFQKWVKE